MQFDLGHNSFTRARHQQVSVDACVDHTHSNTEDNVNLRQPDPVQLLEGLGQVSVFLPTLFHGTGDASGAKDD